MIKVTSCLAIIGGSLQVLRLFPPPSLVAMHHIVEILQKVALNTINQIKSIRYAFAKKDHAVSIYFDLEKTYDTTWKYDILKEIFYMGLKGKLPNVISNFLSGRKFNVRVKSIYSDIQEQEMKVPIWKHALCYIA